MAALNGQEVVSHLALTFRERFSETEFAKIYKDKPVQSMVTPCIFIHSVETTLTPEIRNYAWWDEIIDIRCHPGKKVTNVQSWARTVGPMIVDCAQRITIDGQEVKAKSLTWRVEDNVLHVVGTYHYRVMQKLEDGPDMRTLTYGQRIKNTFKKE